MADIELDDLRQRRDDFRARIIEPVAGMDFEAEALGQQRTDADQLPFGIGLGRPVLDQRVAPGAGVQFDHRRTQLDRRLDLRRRRTDKQRNPDAGVLERMHHRRELRALL